MQIVGQKYWLSFGSFPRHETPIEVDLAALDREADNGR